jgi:hypothetical protein
MQRSVLRVMVISVLAGMMLFSASFASAQTGSTELRGVVKDPSSAVIPNVALTLKDKATGLEKTTVSGTDGAYLFTALVGGTYQLTATASGFQTAVIDGVVINSGRVTDIPVGMKIGAVSTTVEVTAAGIQLELTSNTVSNTIKNTSIQSLPYSSRDSLYFALMMPGANSAGDNRYTTFNGLPNASLNISVDGVNNNSQRFKSGGTSFFQFAPTRIDAMEEVTVQTSGMGAESAGQGAMSIQMITKRGTDRYRFRLLEQWHNEFLNAWPFMTKLAYQYDKTQFKPKTRQNYAVASAGGPALPFIPYFKDKLFFFAYFEANPQPSTSRRSNTMLQSEALTGTYRFIDKSGVTRTLNVLDVAGSAGFRTAIDPTIKGMLDQITATQSTPGTSFQDSTTYPFQRTMYWNYSPYSRAFYPTVRVDYQIKPNISWHGTWNYRDSLFDGAPNYPGEEAFKSSFYQDVSTANVWVISNAVDWTISPKMVNNFTFGNQMNWELFAPGYDIHAWSGYGDKRISLPFYTNLNNGNAAPYISTYAQDDRNNPVWEIKDNLSWVKGRHMIKLGGSYLNTSFWSKYFGNASGVMQPSLGVSSDDPVYNVLYNAMIAANASTTTSDMGNVRSLYAMLTGRLTGISTTLNVNPDTMKFEKFAPGPTAIGFQTLGLYASDSFRWTPQLTLNYGLRWQLDGTIHGTKPIYTMATPGSFFGPSLGNFQPGVLGGNMNPGFEINPKTYNADLINPAPNFGIAWNPNFENAILKKIFGGNKTVIRTSFGMTYYNEGLNSIGNYLSAGSQSITSTANVDFAPGTLFLSSPDPTFSKNPTEFGQPMPLSDYVLKGGRSVNYFNQDLKSPYTSNWTFGIQRELAKGLVIDVRYVGNKSTHMWHMQNLQEINIVENGFAKEFINARNNLALNRAAGVTSFANRGLTGQVALPIFETAFGANGTQPALSSGSSFTSSSYIQNLDRGEAGSLAGTLGSTSGPSLYCRLVGGNFAPCAALGYTTVTKYPMNFFKANPFASNLNYQDSNGDNNYNSLQVELKKSMSRGLMMNFAYTFSKMLGTQGNEQGQAAEDTWITLRDAKLSYTLTGYDHTHNITTYWTYDLPMGPGRWINPSNGILSRIVSNWQIGGIHRFISGAPNYMYGAYSTFNNLGANGGVLFGNGLTIDKLTSKLDNIVGDYDFSCRCFHTDIADLQLANQAINPIYFTDATTPGVIGNPVVYRSKWSYQLDLSVTKEIPITERVKMGLKLDATNFLNHPFQTGYGTLSTTSTSFGRLSSFQGPRTMRIRAYIDF